MLTFCCGSMMKKYLKDFLEIFKYIKFTLKYSGKRTEVLDDRTIKENNLLIRDVYVKTTDIHQYLYATSCYEHH